MGSIDSVAKELDFKTYLKYLTFYHGGEAINDFYQIRDKRDAFNKLDSGTFPEMAYQEIKMLMKRTLFYSKLKGVDDIDKARPKQVITVYYNKLLPLCKGKVDENHDRFPDFSSLGRGNRYDEEKDYRGEVMLTVRERIDWNKYVVLERFDDGFLIQEKEPTMVRYDGKKTIKQVRIFCLENSNQPLDESVFFNDYYPCFIGPREVDSYETFKGRKRILKLISESEKKDFGFLYHLREQTPSEYMRSKLCGDTGIFVTPVKRKAVGKINVLNFASTPFYDDGSIRVFSAPIKSVIKGKQKMFFLFFSGIYPGRKFATVGPVEQLTREQKKEMAARSQLELKLS